MNQPNKITVNKIKSYQGMIINLSMSLSLLAYTLSCGPNSSFKGASGIKAIDPPPPGLPTKAGDIKKNVTPQMSDKFVYKLKISQGEPVIGNIIAPGTVAIFDDLPNPNGSQGQEISADQAVNWKVSTQGPNVPETIGVVGQRSFDFTKASGYTQVTATFVRQTDQLTGFATQTIFIDSVPPIANMIVINKTSEGLLVNINIVDNFGINDNKSRVIACLPGVASPYLKVSQNQKSDQIAPDCVVVSEGADLKAKGSSFKIGEIFLNNENRKPEDLRYFISAVDLVGLNTTNPAIDSAAIQSILELNLAKKPESIVNGDFKLEAQTLLTLIDGFKTAEIHKLPNMWPAYTTTLTCGTGETILPYIEKIPLDTSTEGPASCSIVVKRSEGQLVSNQVKVDYIVDRTPPQFGPIKISNQDGFLGPQSKVTISFSASDANGILSQSLEYRPKGSLTWSVLTEVPTGDRSITVLWGQRPTQDFEVRVVARDRANNLGISQPENWSKPFFNAAVLTTSVECFFCHLKIDGDVAGIDFPADSNIHADSGQNFNITGKIYGTGTVPAVLSSKSAGAVANYKNEELKVFPNTKNSAGKVVFPIIDEAKLEAKTNGLLLNGAGKTDRIARVFNGDLVVTGTATQPFVVNGEVFVKGDLYIKGVYKGQGTIYARNIFVVNDIVSADCLVAQGCPFPFSGSETEKLAQAQTAIAQKKAALYLGALQELLVGSRDHGLISTPGYLPMNNTQKNYLVTLGERALNLKDTANVSIASPSHITSPATDPRVSVEVNRIDAYLYANSHIVWRSYGNLLLNGGMMGYQAALIASYPYNIFHKRNTPAISGDIINPRNGVSAKQNLVRYDYRLRAGGPGFETLKEFFTD